MGAGMGISSFPYGHARQRVGWIVLACLLVALLYWIGEGVAWMRARLQAP